MTDNAIENICDALEKVYPKTDEDCKRKGEIKYVYNKRSKYIHKENCTYVKQMNSEYKAFINLERIKNNPHLQNVKRCSLCMSDDLKY